MSVLMFDRGVPSIVGFMPYHIPEHISSNDNYGIPVLSIEKMRQAYHREELDTLCGKVLSNILCGKVLSKIDDAFTSSVDHYEFGEIDLEIDCLDGVLRITSHDRKDCSVTLDMQMLEEIVDFVEVAHSLRDL